MHIFLDVFGLQRLRSDSTRGNFCVLIMSTSPYEKITVQDLWSLPAVLASFPCPLESERSANSQTGPTSVMNQILNSVIRIFRNFVSCVCGRRELNNHQVFLWVVSYFTGHCAINYIYYNSSPQISLMEMTSRNSLFFIWPSKDVAKMLWRKDLSGIFCLFQCNLLFFTQKRQIKKKLSSCFSELFIYLVASKFTFSIFFCLCKMYCNQNSNDSENYYYQQSRVLCLLFWL